MMINYPCNKQKLLSGSYEVHWELVGVLATWRLSDPTSLPLSPVTAAGEDKDGGPTLPCLCPGRKAPPQYSPSIG